MKKGNAQLFEVVRPDWADRVEEVLAHQGHSKVWLAGLLYLHPSQLSHIMRGDPRYVASPELLDKMSRYLGVPHGWLFGLSEPIDIDEETAEETPIPEPVA